MGKKILRVIFLVTSLMIIQVFNIYDFGQWSKCGTGSSPTYDYITFYLNSGGYLQVNGSTVYNSTKIGYTTSDVLNLSAVASSYYAFDNFTYDPSHTHSNPHDYTVAGNVTVWTNFAQLTGDVTFKMNVAGGTFYANGVSKTNGTLTNYPQGTILNLTAIVPSYHSFNVFNWSTGYTGVNPYNYTVKSASETIWLNFTQNLYTITFIYNTGGNFYLNDSIVSNGTSTGYAYGTTLNMTAVPSSSTCYFVNFTHTGIANTSNPCYYVVSAANTIYLYFQRARAMYGVCAHPWSLTERDFQEMKTLGVKYVRIDFRWNDMSSGRNVALDFSKYDTFVNLSITYEIEIIPILMGVPSWISSSSNSIPTGIVFDDFVAEFGKWSYSVVSRYKNTITYFEVWNEQNNIDFWNDTEATLDVNGKYNRGKAIEKYTVLLKEAYTRAKQANPNCKVIFGGLGGADADYTNGTYKAGVKGYFDYFGIHPYFQAPNMSEKYNPDDEGLGDTSFSYLPKIKNVRAIMENYSDYTPMFVTELGVSCNGITPEMQADRLKRAFAKLNEYTFVDAVCWYQFKDSITSSSYCYSIVLDDWAYTPMYYAYQQILVRS